MFSYSSGPPNGYHGQTSSCTSCHSGSATSGVNHVSISGLPSSYTPGNTYNLVLNLTASSARGYGFQMAVKDNSSFSGTLNTTYSGTRIDSNYFEHTTRVTDSAITFSWTAPSSNSGDITFYLSALATGGSYGTSGDTTYILSETVPVSSTNKTLSLSAGAGGTVSGGGSYGYGTTANITATANTGYTFSGWSGVGVTDTGAASTTVSMTADRSVSASFTLNNHTLSLNAGRGGTVSGGGSYGYGTTASITATPNTGYTFSGWSGVGVTDTGAASTTVSMTADRSVSASFTLNNHTLSLSGGTGGTVSGEGSYGYGTSANITATANTGYTFSGWSGTGVTDTDAATTSVSMTADRNVSASFTLNNHTLSLSAGTGGTVSGGGSYGYGTSANITATANTGYTFSGWSGVGVSDSGASSTTVSMTSDRRLSASFTLNNHTLSLSTGTGGTVSGGGNYGFGTSANITATATTGYTFSGWSGVGVADTDAATTSVSMTADRSVSASFTLNNHTLSLSAGTGGTVSGGGSFGYGTSANITATANLGYTFSGWSGVGVTDTDAVSTTVSMTADRSVSADFELLTAELSFKSPSNGRLTGDGEYSLYSVVSINAFPDNGYRFEKWIGSGIADVLSASTTIDLNFTNEIETVFSLKPINSFNLSIISNPVQGGTTTGSGNFEENKTIVVTATPSIGYSFVQWVGDGLTDRNSTLVLTLNNDSNLSAIFELKKHSLSLFDTTGGKTSGSGIYEHGTTAQISALPDDGFRFKEWLGNGISDPYSQATLIEIDGGVNSTNCNDLVEAGADVLVAGSFVFSSDNPLETIKNLRQVANA